MVYYLKYRPQKIDELDSPSVRDTLKAVLPKNSFHAFLFTGPKGLGKTSAARIVAKFLNCEKRKPTDLEPCNRCYQCTSIAKGNNLDVIEIDAASNRGIDEIRSLRERINLSTTGGKYKIYIIDEVHMLTSEAFNALLKTLEEPPKHAVFVLCTTEPQKLPATIVSRCLHVPFKKAGEEELLRSFKRIVSGEKINIDKEALSEIAKISDGSFRDGSKILQEISAKAGRKKITANFVSQEFRTLNTEIYISKLFNLLKARQTKEALDLIQKAALENDMEYFIEKTLEELHKKLLATLDSEKDGELSLSEIKNLVKLFMRASLQVKYSVIPQLPLELAIIEFTGGDIK